MITSFGGGATCHVHTYVCVLDEQHWEQECLYAHRHYTQGVLCEVVS